MTVISPQQSEIYTLVQSGTQIDKKLVQGKGTELIDNPALIKRAKRKLITQKMVLNLIDIAKEKGDMDRVKSYWNTYHCQSKIVSSENKLYGNYCKNRYCTICSAIRKANIINKYYPALKEWKNAHFVTLTVKSVKAKNLKRWIYGMNLAFKTIKNRCNKRHQRGKGIKLIGIKSLECNFNPIQKTYNPHFHLIVPNKEIADLLKKEWMFQWNKTTTLHSSPKAQHIRPVENIERDLIETIKYGSKIFTEPDLKKKAQRTITPMIYICALDNILSAMKGHRIFDRFGFNLLKQQKNKSSLKLIKSFDNWEYSIKATDWINTSTGECLTGYLEPIELSYLLNEYINKESH